ncbi:MAG: heavy metal-associated domain-containing protein [Pirellula sp.]
MRATIVISLAAYAILTSLMSGCGQKPPLDQSSAGANGSNDVAHQAPDSPQEVSLPRQVSVRVTGMMCPHGCLKDVKQVIEKKNDVVSIELTPQKDPDVIDNPVVVVTYNGVLNRDETTKAILAAGFEKVEFLE